MNPEQVDVYDVHCHIHETPSAFEAIESTRKIVYCVQATKYSDWVDVVGLKDRHGDRIIPGFGVHPWFVERVVSGEIPASWTEELRQMLTRHRGILGECGLDKAARNPDTGQVYPFEPQVQILKTQLTIAYELGVPVSLHCVRAFGMLADVLRAAEKASQLPRLIMLHSYSGSPDMLQQMFLRGELGRRIYVSFSSFVNGRNRAKSVACIQQVPSDRLLVESDLHDATTAAAALDEATALVAEARGWSLVDAKTQLRANSRAFFG
ncbi:Cut9-interacting protein scn1 [Coemansia sp. RSA 2711]|nr:Cut9-interacting protein scn1 [Coemansia sp. RSA 2711]KAJ2363623.1 Cut9-interacting protein scn1 [Coemansia sp. RSA 2610]KAJ2383790.1 Cut9-interacting protein scn1 [Coemansia sp. RSA 2611]